MRKLILSDIFGQTDALIELADAIDARDGIIDPYAGRFMEFGDEATAYAHFMQQVGIAAYAEIVQAVLASSNRPTEIIGFSVGASAVWTLSPDLPPWVTSVVCFYGSQIRHHLQREPNIDVTMVLPALEPGFDVAALAQQLAAIPRVAIEQTNYLHGFMNRKSTNFDPTGYKQFVAWLIKPHEDSHNCQ